jgi:hypothetical protein
VLKLKKKSGSKRLINDDKKQPNFKEVRSPKRQKLKPFTRKEDIFTDNGVATDSVIDTTISHNVSISK